MEQKVVYVGRDLEAMSFAENYHRWILQIFRPYLGKRIVEVGAGTGSFSELILEHPVESLSLVEPSEEMYGILAERIKSIRTEASLKTFNQVFTGVAREIKAADEPDSIIYVNVLEHVSDDAAELEAMRETLVPGGRVFLFVPALSWLYGNFDKQIGHYRRYTKAGLEEVCRRAGFKLLNSGYFDSVGIIPWWIKYRLLKSTTMEPRAVQLYDRYVVPPLKAVESMIAPPIGKNVILIAEKV